MIAIICRMKLINYFVQFFEHFIIGHCREILPCSQNVHCEGAETISYLDDLRDEFDIRIFRGIDLIPRTHIITSLLTGDYTTNDRTRKGGVKMDNEQYIQIGVTALRDPATGDFLPAVPLYIKAEGRAAEEEQRLIDGIGDLLAKRIKAYMDGCNEAGVSV